jgi:hypothetical protein
MRVCDLDTPRFFTCISGGAPAAKLGQRLEVAKGTSPRGLNYHCTDTAANIYSAPFYISRVALLVLRQRRGAAVDGPGSTIKYLRQTTSAAAGNALGTTAKYLCGAATSVWAPRSSTCNAQRGHDPVPAKHNERCRGQQPGQHDQVPAAHNERRRGQWPEPIPGITVAHAPPPTRHIACPPTPQISSRFDSRATHARTFTRGTGFCVILICTNSSIFGGNNPLRSAAEDAFGLKNTGAAHLTSRVALICAADLTRANAPS